MIGTQSTLYQIYPLGAFGAPFENDHKTVHRILAIKDWIPALKELGVDTILFNPLFESRTHGYDTTDYRLLDCRLGDNADLKEVCETLHEEGFHIVFDTVFNHVGRDFPFFQDVLKLRENSPYKDWFRISFDGNNSMNDGLWYESWEGHEELVKLNLANPAVQDWLLSVIDFWKEEFGVDGLRMDVAYCMDRNFLRRLHDHVKAQDPGFFLLGEMIGGDYNQIMNPEMLDSATNYECQKGIYSSFNSKNFYEILFSFNRQFGKENWCLYTGKPLLSFLDNHDVNRIASTLERKEDLPLVYAMLFTMPGIPCLYYGSEWGVEGVKNANDTSLRPCFKELESNELTKTIAKLIRIKASEEALQHGDYSQIAINNPWCVYERQYNGEKIWTAFNLLEEPVQIPVPYQGPAEDLLEEKDVQIDGHIDLGPHSFVLLKLKA